MTTTIANPLFQRLGGAASGAAGLLPAGEQLTATAVGAGVPTDVSLPTAIIAAVQGAAAGELALLVDAELVAAVQAGPGASTDLAVALRPVLEAVAGALQVAVGEPQTMAGPLALHRLASLAEAATVVLHGADRARAALVLGTSAPIAERAPAAAPVSGASSAMRLDLLRGVEMQATVELGRARLTLNDLLSLRDGAVIELDRAAGDAADLSVNGRLIARGEIVVVDENYALRITEIVSGENGA